MNAHLQPTGSAYFISPETAAIENHTLSVLVDNEPGVLARVIGLFSGRGYNIESLTVSETEHQAHLSRITIVTRGTPQVLEQIKAQLERIIPVHRVVDQHRKRMALDRRGFRRNEIGGARGLKVWIHCPCSVSSVLMFKMPAQC